MGVAGQEEEVLDPPNPDDPPNGDEPVDPPPGDDAVDPPKGGEEAEEEDLVQIGDEEPPASEEREAAPKWVKDLREKQRSLARENAELKARLGTGQQPAQQGKPVLPEYPKLAEYDFDEDKHQEAVKVWSAKEREVERWEADQKNAADAQAAAVKQVHENYQKSKAALKVKHFQEAEDEVVGALNVWQQAIVMKGPENPAAMVAALGTNTKKLAEMASIKDPVKFAVAVGNLQRDIKVTKRTSTKPAPEAPLRGNSSAPVSTATLDRLRAEADRTGDRSKVAKHIREQRQAGK